MILDSTIIGEISDEDGKFLSEFKNLESLSMNATGLKSLSNLPSGVKMVKVSLTNTQYKIYYQAK